MTSGANATSSAVFADRSESLRPKKRQLHIAAITQPPQTLPECAEPALSLDRPGERQKRADPSQRSPCCARAASGHAATAPPSSVMNSRRFN